VSRVRIRYENGQEVSRQAESETIVRPPENRVVAYGTKVVTHTTTVGGTKIEYWRAVQMFATSYSPCRSGSNRCYSGTSSGKPVKKGVVAMTYANYIAMQGQPLFIPGYGYATVEDVGGGISGQLWIDLGYSDDDWQQWGQWVTVYFLTPVPASFPYILDY
jgi:3D (Asp-Asp-Asp) domain-containing protein